MDNDKTPHSKQDFSLEEMDRVLNLVSSLTKKMSIYGYSTHISNHAISNSCIIHPFGFHSEGSCPDLLLSWEITMEGKYDSEQASLGYEAENILIDDINETYNLKGRLMMDFSSLKEPKVFPCASGVVNHEIRPPEGEITMYECTPMVGDSLDEVIYFHYPS